MTSSQPPIAGPAADPVAAPVLALALEDAGEAVFGILPSGAFCYANAAACRSLGYTREELLALTVADVDPGYPAGRWPEHWQEVLRAGGLSLETVHRRKDGSEFPVEVATRVHATGGEARMFAHARDLTARRAAESALRASEERFQRAFHAIPEAVAISRLEDGTYLEVGEGFEAVFGWPPAEAVGRSPLDLGIWVDPADRARMVASVRTGVVRTGLEARLRRRDGTEFMGLVSVRALDLDGRPYLLSVTRDISERTRLEESLRASEARYRALFTSMSDAFASVDMDGRITGCNQAFLDLVGRSEAEVRRLTYEDLTPASWHAMEAEVVRTQVLRRGQSDAYEKEYLRGDGQVVAVELRTFLNPGPDGAPAGMSAIVRDISVRKGMESALRESESRHRTLFQTMAQGVLGLDLEGRIVLANRAAERILGADQSLLLGRTLQDPAWGWVREDGSPFPGGEHPALAALASGRPVMDEVMGIPGAGQGGHRWALVSATPEFREEATVPHRVIVTLTDITHQKRVEGELRAAEGRLHTVVSNSQAVIYQLDREGHFTLSEGRGLEGLGLRPGEVVGGSALEMYAPFPDVTEQIGRALAGEAVRAITTVGPMVFDHNLSPVLDAQGRVASVIGIATDITARKRAEDALRDSEARFRAIFEFEPEGVLVLSTDGVVLDINPAGLALLQVAGREEAVGGSMLDVVAEPWREGFLRMLGRVAGGEAVQEAFEIVGVQNARRHLETSAAPLRGAGSGVTSLLVVLRDVTARKQAEDELRASEARYRSLYERTPVMLHSIERSGRIISVSDQWLSRLGYRREEVLGRPTTDFMTGASSRHAVERVLPEFFRTGSCANVPYQFVTRNGELVDILLSATAERDATGQVQNSLAVLVDVTERMRALDALRRSEERFGALFEAMTEGVALLELVRDAEGTAVDYRVLDVNPGFEGHLGIPAVRARGALASDLYGLGRPPFLDAFAQVAATGRATSFEAWFPPLDKHLHIGAVHLGGDHFATIFEDVTEQIRRMEALRESEASYRGLFDGVHEAIYIQDEAGRFLDVNRGAVEMYGHAREAFIGRTPEFLSAPGMNDLPQVGAQVARAFEGEAQQFEFWGLRANGEVFPKEVRVYPGTYFGQKVVVALSRDISERRRSEEALRQTQKLESLGVLAGGIAHDFNNLLTAVMGNLNLAQTTLPETAPAQPYLDAVERTVLKARELTKQMLAYSGKGRFVVKAHDLNAVVGELLHLLQVSISKKAELQIDLQEGLPAIMAEAAQVQQVVMNLVTNASDALGTAPGRIRVATSLRSLDAATAQRQFPGQELAPGDFVALEVSDTGCGMPEEVQTRIFDPFFTTKASGRGLGLSALLGILRGHRAGIRIRSEVGRGSTFEVLFPASDAPAPRGPEAGLKSARTFSGTVLLVDDEEMILESTGMALETLGFTVVTAADGLEGLERFLTLGPELALVLMDLSMPRMDGVTAFLAMHKARPGVPVLLSSGYDPQEPGEDLLAKGLAGFLQKPYRLKELSDALAAALAGRAGE